MTTQEKIYSYFDRNPELRVLFVFKEGLFSEEDLSGAEWREGYRYVVFGGDWFTCKYRLDNEWKDDKVVFYFDMPSPMNSSAAKERFPLMDVLVANAVFHPEDHVAFMEQFSLPSEMAAFVAANVGLLQSDKMVAMLEPSYRDGNATVDVATRGILSVFLSQKSVLSWDEILILVLLNGRESERKRQTDFFRKVQNAPMVLETLKKRFTDIFGVEPDLNSAEKVKGTVQVLKYNAIAQNLAPVEADNYKNLRIKDAFALQQLNRMLERILDDTKYSAAFEVLLDELGDSIRCSELVKWYGKDADFYYIPKDLHELILRDILENDMGTGGNVMERLSRLVAALGGMRQTDDVLDFASCVAQYYEKENAVSSTSNASPAEFVRFYENDFYLIDQLYRQAIEIYNRVNPSHSLYESVQLVKKSLDRQYARTAHRMNIAWLDCVRVVGGFGNLPLLRQWNFYENRVKPLQKKVAVIICDALRYELAKQLFERLAKTKHTAEIFSAIATLPTETKFCKPSLLPHRELRLTVNDADVNMSVDGKVLGGTPERSTHLQLYRNDASCEKFSDIDEYNQDRNREIFKKSLVYIYYNEIDKIGHSDSAKQVVAGCSQAVEDLARMITKIHASYNVTEVYVTSDHGFLFNDMEFEDKDKVQVREESLEQKSRYYLTKSAEDVVGVVKFPLNEVSGMAGEDNVMVAVPAGTNRFAAPSGGYVFAHGGGSLQEMLIPVIVSRQERKDTKDPVGVAILAKRLSVQASRLRFELLQTKAVDMDNRERTVEVALYHHDNRVSPVCRIVLDKTDDSLDNRKYLVDLTLNKDVSAGMLQLKVYDSEDGNNPLIIENVTNNTLIENDFDF